MNAVETAKKKISLEEYFKNGYVLVVDDMPSMRKTIKSMLRQVGVNNVVEVEDGDAALKHMNESVDQRCLFVLLDWNMPKMPGIFVTRELRAHSEFGEIPILMVTAEINKEQIAQAVELGVNGYVIKPFVAKTLEEKMINILEARDNPPQYIKLLKAGEVLAKKGQYQKALAIFNEAMNLNGGARVMVHIGDMHELMGEFSKAVDMYGAAAETNPMFLKAHIKAADLHAKTGEDDLALAALDKANEISPGNPDRHMAAGKIHLKKGDEEKASQAFGNIIRLAPDRVSEVAEELLKGGKPHMAEGLFRRSLESGGGSVHTYNRLGIALRRQGKWKEAIEEYKKAIAMDETNEALYFNMAKAYEEGGDYASALANFEKVLRLSPGLEEAIKEIEAIKNRK
ncbi:MAG: tetratricopeptide repeat protein [Nitrospinae bacterium]|nr:tetratricopeptide repeat protein [Nitrospinota bacterium]